MAQRDTDDLTVFFSLCGSLLVRASCKHIGEIDSETLFVDLNSTDRFTDFNKINLLIV